MFLGLCLFRLSALEAIHYGVCVCMCMGGWVVVIYITNSDLNKYQTDFVTAELFHSVVQV